MNLNIQGDFQVCISVPLTVFENKRNFMKKAVLHTTTLMRCKARQVLRDLFSTNRGNGSEMRFVAGAT